MKTEDWGVSLNTRARYGWSPFHSILYCSSLYQQSNESQSEINFGSFIFCRDSKTAGCGTDCSQMVSIYQSSDPVSGLLVLVVEEDQNSTKKWQMFARGWLELEYPGDPSWSNLRSDEESDLRYLQIWNRNGFITDGWVTCRDSPENFRAQSRLPFKTKSLRGKFFLIDFPTSSPVNFV